MIGEDKAIIKKDRNLRNSQSLEKGTRRPKKATITRLQKKKNLEGEKPEEIRNCVS